MLGGCKSNGGLETDELKTCVGGAEEVVLMEGGAFPGRETSDKDLDLEQFDDFERVLYRDVVVVSPWSGPRSSSRSQRHSILPVFHSDRSRSPICIGATSEGKKNSTSPH